MPRGVYKRIKPNWIKGKTHSPETREKISLARKGNGHKQTHETREKISKKLKGVPKLHFKGKKFTQEHKDKISKSHQKEKSYKWIKDRSKLKKYNDSEEKRSPAYKFWRKEICCRDNWKCRLKNEECNGRLEVHHILSWRDYPELRYIINNGITLCHFHHPRKREEEKRMIPIFQELLSVSSE